jgi:hypothetical protein
VNTQSHAILTFFLVRWVLGDRAERLKRVNTFIFSGALLPDLPICLFFFWYTLIEPASQRVIWSEIAFRQDWQVVFSLFHSFPLWGSALATFFAVRMPRAGLFCIAGLLSAVQDFLVHHDDGHAHFFPFSDYRFASPVSYWDPAHYGWYASTLEFVLVVAAALWAYPRLETGWGKALLIVAALSLLAIPGLWALLFSFL